MNKICREPLFDFVYVFILNGSYTELRMISTKRPIKEYFDY